MGGMSNKGYKPILNFRSDPLDKGGNRGSKTLHAPFSKDQTRREDLVLCKFCLNRITNASEQMAVEGKLHHTFANPEGIVYEISCFKSAIGCMGIGSFSAQFSWFGGYEWQVAVCRACQKHMGWFFAASSGSSFSGLIVPHVVISKS